MHSQRRERGSVKKDSKEKLKKAFLEYFKDTPIQKYAAYFIGRDEDTIGVWKKEDKGFSDQIDKLRAEYVQKKLGKVKSEEWVLERVFRTDFAQRQEITGEGGKELIVKVVDFK